MLLKKKKKRKNKSKEEEKNGTNHWKDEYSNTSNR